MKKSYSQKEPASVKVKFKVKSKYINQIDQCWGRVGFWFLNLDAFCPSLLVISLRSPG